MIEFESKQLFSESEIWKLQHDYFDQEAINAWSSGEVPHYITSNPKVGVAYAEMVLALLRDLALKGKNQEPVYLIELGAGHGRLCYHFFKHLEKYYESSAIDLPPFRYILSDISAQMVEFWKDHLRFQPYIEKGWLDFAFFNANSDAEIVLQHSGEIISHGSLEQPLVAIGNYFFDSIPQELFRIQDGEIDYALVSSSFRENSIINEPREKINALEMKYTYEKVLTPIFADENLNELLEFYRENLSNTHVLFPHIGIRCLERLKALSKSGLMLLSGDKGQHHLSNLEHLPPPQLVRHGSFSLSVNYHALSTHCANLGGLPLLSRHQHATLDVVCLLYLDHAKSYLETIQAFERHIQDFGPDDYFSLKKLVEKNLGSLTYQEIITMIRMSAYDATIFVLMLPDLKREINALSENQRLNLLMIIPRIWDNYFPLKEATDIAANLGDVLFQLGLYTEAILFYEKSLLIYGRTEHILHNITLCFCLLDKIVSALPLIHELKLSYPENQRMNQLEETFNIKTKLT